MPKEDIKQINRIAKEFKMTIEERKGFGKFIETEKNWVTEAQKMSEVTLPMKNYNKKP